MYFCFIYVASLLCGLATAVPHPEFIEYRRSLVGGRSGSEPVKYIEAPNVNKTFIESMEVVPASVSFHYEKPLSAKVHSSPVALIFLKTLEELVLCPIFILLDADSKKRPLVTEVTKKMTRSLALDDDRKSPLICVLTDNKSYIVSVGPGSGTDATVMSITKLIDPLPPQEELNIKEKLEELNFDYNPISEVTKEDCLSFLK